MASASAHQYAFASYDTDATPYTKDGQTLKWHKHRAFALIDKAYNLSQWRDPTPVKADEKQAWQAHRREVLHPPTRFAISTHRHRMMESFNQYRKAQLEAEALTPYDCGSHGDAAIPCYIVACESGFDWGAVNPSSGAFGWYQFLPSTYAGVCDRCDRSKTDQHEAAGDVYARSGGSEWVCA